MKTRGMKKNYRKMNEGDKGVEDTPMNSKNLKKDKQKQPKLQEKIDLKKIKIEKMDDFDLDSYEREKLPDKQKAGPSKIETINIDSDSNESTLSGCIRKIDAANANIHNSCDDLSNAEKSDGEIDNEDSSTKKGLKRQLSSDDETTVKKGKHEKTKRAKTPSSSEESSSDDDDDNTVSNQIIDLQNKLKQLIDIASNKKKNTISGNPGRHEVR
ncbi:Histone transcription regulator 3-like protein [Frankliniella fusca]|uniref:Histone transcription regulator 3-like protein n=1 Tax=Frankliniella fusca TaxID=407009 RepID=A0AAE1LUB1_9NEOP|nr:Histone transcription regulator 3-like protein [Frankliniella fusca]